MSLRVRIVSIALLTMSCGGYSDTSVASCDGAVGSCNSQVVEVDAQAPTARPAVDMAPGRAEDDVPPDDLEPPVNVEEVSPEASQGEPSGDVRLARNARFDGYLTDAQGRALYMFADDVAAAGESACLNDCAREWPPFDAPTLAAGSGIAGSELERFHRLDGAWQTTFKGHPLYYRASELGTAEVTGDGLLRRWFVARDYLAFFSREALFGGTDPAPALCLTDGFGRTLYVCLDDVPSELGTQPVSTCTGECLALRPPWYTTSTLRTTILPSTLELSAFTGFTRFDGGAQLSFRGWPLYYFRGDEQLGATAGHNQRAWRAVDPQTFGSSR